MQRRSFGYSCDGDIPNQKKEGSLPSNLSRKRLRHQLQGRRKTLFRSLRHTILKHPLHEFAEREGCCFDERIWRWNRSIPHYRHEAYRSLRERDNESVKEGSLSIHSRWWTHQQDVCRICSFRLI